MPIFAQFPIHWWFSVFGKQCLFEIYIPIYIFQTKLPGSHTLNRLKQKRTSCAVFNINWKLALYLPFRESRLKNVFKTKADSPKWIKYKWGGLNWRRKWIRSWFCGRPLCAPRSVCRCYSLLFTPYYLFFVCSRIVLWFAWRAQTAAMAWLCRRETRIYMYNEYIYISDPNLRRNRVCQPHSHSQCHIYRAVTQSCFIVNKLLLSDCIWVWEFMSIKWRDL